MKVRTRFAPSPTGSLHIGGARTALFNWLYARHAQGEFVLRLEDSDQERNTQASVASLLDGLRWLGLNWDEGPRSGEADEPGLGPCGPYFQSRRTEIYRRYVDRLLERNLAYRQNGVVRFRMPREPVVIPDLIVGEVTRELTDREAVEPDFVIVRSDGMPVFHLVNVVDDLEMGITHVIRGEDHLSNTSRHLALIRALERTPPQYAHLPLILNSDGTKMSKRDQGTSVEYYRQERYLPEAMANYLCLLGWSPGNDQEILSLEELIERFDLSGVQRHNARFDLEKLRWLNGDYLARLETSRFHQLASATLQAHDIPVSTFPTEYVRDALETARGKTRTLAELIDYAGFYFRPDDAVVPPPELAAKHLNPSTREGMRRLHRALAELTDYSPEAVENCFRRVAADLEVKLRALVHPIRLACTGSVSGPSLWGLIAILGQEVSLRRIERAIARIE